MNYNISMTMLQMVYNKLPFVEINTTNDTIIGMIINEVCNEFKAYFNVTIIADDNSYTEAQKSVISDVVCIYILQRTSFINSIGNPTLQIQPNLTFLKRAKAGSAESEFESIKIKDTVGLHTTLISSLEFFQKSAERKFKSMGFRVNFTDTSLEDTSTISFIVP